MAPSKSGWEQTQKSKSGTAAAGPPDSSVVKDAVKSSIAASLSQNFLSQLMSSDFLHPVEQLCRAIVAEMLEPMPKLGPEDVTGLIRDELKQYGDSRDLAVRIVQESQKVAEGVAAQKVDEAIKALPKVTVKDVRSAAGEAVDEYHSSGKLDKKIDQLARALAVEIAEARVAQAVKALPRLTTDDLKQSLEAYHASPKLEDKIEEISAQRAEEIADQKVTRLAETVKGLPKLTEADVEAAVRAALEGYHASPALSQKIAELAETQAGPVASKRVEEAIAALPKLTSEDVKGSVMTALKAYHESARLSEKIEGLAKSLVEELIESRVSEAIGGLPKVTPEDVQRTVESYHASGRLQEKIESLARSVATETVAQLPKVTPEAVDAAARLAATEICEERILNLLRTLPKLKTEDVRGMLEEALKEYHGSAQLEERIDSLARESAEQIATARIAEAMQTLPKVTEDDVRAALDRYHASGLLEEKIRTQAEEIAERALSKRPSLSPQQAEELAQRVADETAKRHVAEAVQALPQVSPDAVQEAARDAVTSYHESKKLEQKITSLARTAAERIAQDAVSSAVKMVPTLSEKDVKKAAADVLDEYHDSKRLERKLEQAAREAATEISDEKIERALKSLPKVGPKEVSHAVDWALQKYHDSEELGRKIEERAREVAEAAAAAVPKLTLEEVQAILAESIKSYHASEVLERRVAELSLDVAEEVAQKRVREAMGALPKLTEEDVRGIVERLADGIAARQVQEGLQGVSRLTEADVQKAADEAVDRYHGSKNLEKRVESLALEVVEQVTGKKADESIDRYHGSKNLERKIESLAREVAEQICEQKTTQAVKALPRMTPEDVAKAVAEGIKKFGASDDLEETVRGLALEVSEEAVQAKPSLTMAQVEARAKELAEGIATQKVAGSVKEVLKLATAESKAMVEKASEEARKMAEEAAASKVSEAMESLKPRKDAEEAVEAFASSDKLRDMITESAGRAAEEKIVALQAEVHAVSEKAAKDALVGESLWTRVSEEARKAFTEGLGSDAMRSAMSQAAEVRVQEVRNRLETERNQLMEKMEGLQERLAMTEAELARKASQPANGVSNGHSNGHGSHGHHRHHGHHTRMHKRVKCI